MKAETQNPGARPYTLNRKPYALHPTPYTRPTYPLHPEPYNAKELVEFLCAHALGGFFVFEY